MNGRRIDTVLLLILLAALAVRVHLALVPERRADGGKREQALASGRLDYETLYVLRPPQPAAFRGSSDDAIGTVDGFLVLAPRWFAFDDCCGGAMPALARASTATETQR